MTARALLWLALVPQGLLAGCVLLDPGGVELQLDPSTVYADGFTEHSVTLCSAAQNPAAEVAVTLRASSGVFRPHAPAGESDAELVLFGTGPQRCAMVRWVPTDEPGLTRFEVFADDDLLHVENVTSLAAVPATVTLNADSPFLSDEGSSQRTLSAELLTRGGGSASVGTVTRLSVANVEPSDREHLVVLSTDTLVVGRRESATVYAPAGVMSLTVRATVVLPEGDSISGCTTLLAPTAEMPPDTGC